MGRTSFRKIDYECRKEIERLYNEGLSIPKIVEKTKTGKSGVYWELRRACSPNELDKFGRPKYDALTAERIYQTNIRRRGRKKKGETNEQQGNIQQQKAGGGRRETD